jgi:hypothetical protein
VVVQIHARVGYRHRIVKRQSSYFGDERVKSLMVERMVVANSILVA